MESFLVDISVFCGSVFYSSTLFSIFCPSGLRIPGFIIFSLPNGAVDTCLLILFYSPIGAADTCFLFFFSLAHRGIGYLLIPFPSEPPTLWPIGVTDTCFLKIFFFWPIGASDTCFFFFYFSLPIGASDTCFNFCFSGPSGPRIPALIFFFHRPSVLFMDEKMLVLWVVALSGISTLFFAADHLVVCECTYGFGRE